MAIVSFVVWLSRLEFKVNSLEKITNNQSDEQKQILLMLTKINDRLLVIETLVAERNK
jgi:uncharacterized membrane protein YidH (DUF202 family)